MYTLQMCSGIGMCYRRQLKEENHTRASYADDVDDYEPQGLSKRTATTPSSSVELHDVGRSTADLTTIDMKPMRDLDVVTTDQPTKVRL
ncbi:hypothetical protein ANCCAN_28959, partial [Ancylostoma caninum]